jgi:hypothetical protein
LHSHKCLGFLGQFGGVREASGRPGAVPVESANALPVTDHRGRRISSARCSGRRPPDRARRESLAPDLTRASAGLFPTTGKILAVEAVDPERRTSGRLQSCVGVGSTVALS